MRNNAQPSWDDLIYVLAVADHGSVLAASRALSVNHATVLRRIAAFEERHSFRLFDKTSQGYRVAADRRAVIEAMREAGQALGAVERMIEAERPRLDDGLRITTTDTIARFILPPILKRYTDQTGVRIELLAGNAHLDFDRMEAHLTVRPTPNLPAELSGMPGGALRFELFGTPGGSDAWLGLSGPLARSVAATWLRQQSGPVAMMADSFLTLAALAADGVGRTLLPHFVGSNWPGLVRQDGPADIPAVPVWVAAHVDFAKSGRINRARKYIAHALQTESPLAIP